jgi:serine protease DegQ
VGDYVVAIGNPFEIGQTVTAGIVSALGRARAGGGTAYVQTDAPINPGNSGGPLISMRGEVIGINSAIVGPGEGNVGIGLAVPSNTAKAVMNAILSRTRGLPL